MISFIGDYANSAWMELILVWAVTATVYLLKMHPKVFETVGQKFMSAPTHYRTDIYIEKERIWYLFYITLHVGLQELLVRGIVAWWIFALITSLWDLSMWRNIILTVLITNLIFVSFHFQYWSRWIALWTLLISTYRTIDYLLHGSLLIIILSHGVIWLYWCLFDKVITKDSILRNIHQLQLLKKSILLQK